jgi:hypothetical protein
MWRAAGPRRRCAGLARWGTCAPMTRQTARAWTVKSPITSMGFVWSIHSLVYQPGHDIDSFALRLARPSGTIVASSSAMYGRLQEGFKLFEPALIVHTTKSGRAKMHQKTKSRRANFVSTCTSARFLWSNLNLTRFSQLQPRCKRLHQYDVRRQ